MREGGGDICGNRREEQKARLENIQSKLWEQDTERYEESRGMEKHLHYSSTHGSEISAFELIKRSNVNTT